MRFSNTTKLTNYEINARFFVSTRHLRSPGAGAGAGAGPDLIPGLGRDCEKRINVEQGNLRFPHRKELMF